MISLQSMGYLKYLCIYFKNKINYLPLVWMESWHQGIAISVLHRRLLLLLWFLWCGCCKPMELHQYTIMQLYWSISELFFLCFSFSLSTKKAQTHKSQIIEIIIKELHWFLYFDYNFSHTVGGRCKTIFHQDKYFHMLYIFYNSVSIFCSLQSINILIARRMLAIFYILLEADQREFFIVTLRFESVMFFLIEIVV